VKYHLFYLDWKDTNKISFKLSNKRLKDENNSLNKTV
jgi:hypothetical protein